MSEPSTPSFQGMCHYIGQLSKASKAGIRAALADCPKCHFNMLEGLLHSINCHGKDGAIYVSDLAREIRQPLPAVSRGLRLMEQDGTVVREPDPADRRKTLVRVTPKGYELCHQCEQALRDYFASVLARLEPEQVAQMDALRGALMDAILAEMPRATLTRREKRTMTKIFKQLARHWAVCLVVFALLFVQAYCDLALPDYTSKIVDTGIQQGGIESPLPQTVRQSTLDTLSLLMSEEDAQKLQNAYQYYLQDDGVLQLRSDLTEDERTALEDAVTTPDIVLYMAAAQAANTPAGQNSMGMTGLAEMPSAAADTDTETVTPTAADLDTVCSQFAAMSQMPGFDRSMLQKQLDSAMSQLDSTLLENLKSQSLLLVQLEYEAQGVARNVQMGYLFRVGGQMLALTLLMVVVAVAVGFLASRVSAAIGRDLRRETFSSVIGFSNAEIENFSTASLITRTTNDIQQVQFVCVILLRMVAYAPILGIGGVLHVVGSSSGLSWIVVLDVAILLLLIIS